MTTENNKISDMIAIVGGADIYFPRKLIARRDISEDAKFIFACALTDNSSMTLDEFSSQLILLSSKAKKKRTQRELRMLAGQLDEILVS